MDNLIGKTLGQYQILELAGKGGMAVVYKAFQPSLNRYVALKVLPDYLAQDDQFVLRFEHEARAAAALRHSNIMVIYDVGLEGNTHYIAAEYLEGHTLSQVIAELRGPLPLQRTVNTMSQLASALDFAHQRGLVHRDIKPSNVFVDADDHVTLMDFGIAKALQGGAQMTRTGTMVGTPEYMSPEQAEGKQIDQRSDIYSLGVMLYQLLTGRVPFAAETPTAILLAHVMQTPMLPRQLNAAIPPAVESVVMRSLAKRPQDRFASAGELAQALAQAASGALAQSPAYIPPTVVPGRPTPTPPPVYAPGTPPPTSQPVYGQPPYTPPPAYTPPPGKSGGGANWLLWGGMGLAAVALVCVLGFVGLYVIGKSAGTPTPTKSVARATATSASQPATRSALAPTATKSVARATATPASVSSGSVLFTDNFSSQKASEDKGWSFEAGDNVDYTWSANKLTISVKKTQWLGWDTPDGTYDNFGVEIEAQPTSSGYAEYGIIFRITGSGDTRSYYVFGVNTSGKYFLQKRVEGKWADPDPISATASQAIKPNGKNTLRVLAQGATISLYVNGSLVKTVSDDSITGGGKVGVYAGTDKNTASAQVAFSRMTILTAEKAQAEWGVGAVLFKDDFSDPGSGWSVKETDNTAKAYKDGKYVITVKSAGYTGWGTVADKTFDGGVVIDVDATLTDGPTDNDLGIICHHQDDDNFYYLSISSDGYAGIQKESGGSGLTTLSGDGKMHSSLAVKKGKGVANHIRAICDVGVLTLVVNGTQVAQVQDADFEGGGVGLAATAYKDSGGGVVLNFDNFVVSKIQ